MKLKNKTVSYVCTSCQQQCGIKTIKGVVFVEAPVKEEKKKIANPYAKAHDQKRRSRWLRDQSYKK